MKKKRSVHIIRINNELVHVSEDLYDFYYQSLRHEKYLTESDQAHGCVSYEELSTKEISGQETLPDLISESLEDIIIKKDGKRKLDEALNQLNHNDFLLIDRHFYKKIPETELAIIYSVNQSTISRRISKISKKLILNTNQKHAIFTVCFPSVCVILLDGRKAHLRHLP